MLKDCDDVRLTLQLAYLLSYVLNLRMTPCKYQKFKATYLYVVSCIWKSADMRTEDEGCGITQQRNTHEMAANQMFHVGHFNLLLQNNITVLHPYKEMTELFCKVQM
jgi:hypothetical protein